MYVHRLWAIVYDDNGQKVQKWQIYFKMFP